MLYFIFSLFFLSFSLYYFCSNKINQIIFKIHLVPSRVGQSSQGGRGRTDTTGQLLWCGQQLRHPSPPDLRSHLALQKGEPNWDDGRGWGHQPVSKLSRKELLDTTQITFHHPRIRAAIWILLILVVVTTSSFLSLVGLFQKAGLA